MNIISAKLLSTFYCSQYLLRTCTNMKKYVSTFDVLLRFEQYISLICIHWDPDKDEKMDSHQYKLRLIIRRLPIDYEEGIVMIQIRLFVIMLYFLCKSDNYDMFLCRIGTLVIICYFGFDSIYTVSKRFFADFTSFSR